MLVAGRRRRDDGALLVVGGGQHDQHAALIVVVRREDVGHRVDARGPLLIEHKRSLSVCFQISILDAGFGVNPDGGTSLKGQS